MKVLVSGILLFVQLLLALIAAFQAFGLLPALSWLGSPSNIPAGQWIAAGLKAGILAVAVLLWWGCGSVRARLMSNARPS